YAHRALILMRTGRLGEALEWASSLGVPNDGGIPYAMEDQALILARLCIAGGHLARAVGLLARLRAGAEGGGRQGRLIQIGALESLLLDAQGDSSGALEILTQTLTLAQPERYVRTFVDLGEPMRQLLERVTSMRDYAARLEMADTAAQGRPIQDGLVEPLSDRELDVLALMAEGLTNQEIADRLFIFINTVKTHAKSLYGKLSVRGRAQAALRARELNLILVAPGARTQRVLRCCRSSPWIVIPNWARRQPALQEATARHLDLNAPRL
ncbi:MAG: LuxR C-terminal-related transcriptional regulator, partial [Anaerolineae bacterium]|nr:LuxR C-terminal-related transcriptional regulator [Anaerolineae bacterium]